MVIINLTLYNDTFVARPIKKINLSLLFGEILNAGRLIALTTVSKQETTWLDQSANGARELMGVKVFGNATDGRIVSNAGEAILIQ